MGSLPPNKTSRIAQHVRKGEGKKERTGSDLCVCVYVCVYVCVCVCVCVCVLLQANNRDYLDYCTIIYYKCQDSSSYLINFITFINQIHYYSTSMSNYSHVQE